jgi:hypothetical protein
MNHTTFAHPKAQDAITRAMRNAQRWGVDHVFNCKGHAYLAVRFHEGRFLITDKKGVSRGAAVHKALVSASNFWSLLRITR